MKQTFGGNIRKPGPSSPDMKAVNKTIFSEAQTKRKLGSFEF